MRPLAQQVLANNASAQYPFGLTLVVGEELPPDRLAGKDPLTSDCWLVCARLLDQLQAQEK